MSIKNQPKIDFGTDGWRGIIADDFTFPNVYKVTRAIARYLETAYTKERPVLIGYDTRFLADRFAYAAAQALAEMGWSVKISQRDCPTPAIAYNARYLEAAGALMFTASHNPPRYCGIKYIPDYAGPATTEITEAIVAYLEVSSDESPSGDRDAQISSFDPKSEYLKFVYSFLDIGRIRSAGLKVKYDARYSTSRGYLDEALNYCHCQLETFHNTRDVLFGGGLPEVKAEQLTRLIKAVKQDQADLGLATDGDSDRFGIIDEQGNAVTPNTVLLVLALHLLNNKGKTGAIVRNMATTHLLDNLALNYGLECFETPVGFKYIGQKMRETQVLIGGEESGGVSILGHIPEKDGILANLLVVEAIAYEGKPLSQLVEEAIKAANGPLYDRHFDLPLSEHPAAILNNWQTNPPVEVAGIKVKTINQQDGIKLYLE
ncbi:MAG: phosphoglucomutase/phosphomannomutase family protein, partial [Microcystaceae cyanobacterium]